LIGFGCMRLSTRPARQRGPDIAVIHAALDAGATLLDTADAYAHDDREIGHNEGLIAEALQTWSGDRGAITVATKGGLRRPNGAWVPDGRAKHLRAACGASRRVLGVDVIDLYQLHVVDPRVPLGTSVRALAALRAEGKIRRIGLCNVNVTQIALARSITEIDAVQVSISVLDDENLRNGVAEYCRDHGIMLLAHRPLGGDRNVRIGRDALLHAMALRHGVSPHVIALAWLRDLAPVVVPIPGATHREHAAAIANAARLELSEDDRQQLDEHLPAGRLLRVPRTQRRPTHGARGDVVVVMGMPGAGKSTVAEELVQQGYTRLNRDTEGGRVSGLIEYLDDEVQHGQLRWVLDNTYASRAARNEVIETAWRHGIAARCIHVTTSLADAQINAVNRMIEAHGRLLDPTEIRVLGRNDPRCFGPDALFRYERTVEPPVLDEGFTRIDERVFARHVHPAWTNRALVLDFDDVLCASRSPILDPADIVIAPETIAALRAHAAHDWIVLSIAWRPQLDAGVMSDETMRACLDRARAQLGIDIDIAYCPHAAGPPVCWCRKPLPGLLLQFAYRHQLALEHSIIIGRSAADRTLADRLGMTQRDHLFADVRG
jgi:aryl-alcohol dehydrogenase-like predicted oxidoreductase/histidinol phosphatase-like enzyme